jgi:hypothetical protein
LTPVITFWKFENPPGLQFPKWELIRSVRVHSFTFFYTPGSMRCDSQASFLARTLASPGLGCEPNARVATNFYIKFKAFAIFFKNHLTRWRSKVHLMPWITISYPPLVATSNWCGEKCVTKASQNWRHKAWFVNQYNVPPFAMGWTPPKGLVRIGEALQGYVQFNMGCDFEWYWDKIETIVGIHLQNLSSENNFEGVQKPS